MPRKVYDPWVTETMTITGWSGSTPHGASIKTRKNAQTLGAQPSMSRPWRTLPNRLAVGDALKNQGSGSALSPTNTSVFLGPPLQARTVLSNLLSAGANPIAIVDPTFGLAYDDYEVDVSVPDVQYSLATDWLARMYATPGVGVYALTDAEWASMWHASDATAGRDGREFDLYASAATLHATYTTIDASDNHAGGVFDVALQPAGGTGGYQHPYVVAGYPATGDVAGTTRDLPVTWTAWTYGGSPVSIADDQVNLMSFVRAATTYPDLAQDTRMEYVRDATSFLLGFDHGYDESGIDYSAPQHGGPGADRSIIPGFALDATITVRWRWYRYVAGTPPLWQRQRIGAVDSPEGFSSGLVTPQSSPWQGGTL